MLKLLDIKKEYKVADTCVTALKGINLEFRQNEFVSILGPSGCGKTTLLNIIGGLDKYSYGDLQIEGISTTEFKESYWDAYRNHKIGFVFQSYNLISHLNVISNVELALTISGVSASERKQRAKDALEKVGLKEHIHKMPNQLSGGQMQRVAIARAIVNNPEILLADEPTGALDTTTSVEIMEIMKDISKERLVVMVTHNPELAEQYSTRIIKLLDGEVVEDSNPFDSTKSKKKSKKTINQELKTQDNVKAKKKKNSPFKKTSMSFWTALTLSFKNLLSKKGRTLLVSIASSIGIIGVSLVLALSNGFNLYIGKLQADMLSSYPLNISNSAVNVNAVADLIKETDLEKFPISKEVIVNKVMSKLTSITHNGKITNEFVAGAIDTIDPTLYYGIIKETGQYLNVYAIDQRTKQYKYISKKLFMTETTSINNSNGLGMVNADTKWQILLDNKDFVLSQYQVIAGEYPKTTTDLVLIVDEYNRVGDITLESLGFNSLAGNINFNDMIGTKFYVMPNDKYYIEDNVSAPFKTLPTDIKTKDFDKEGAIELTIGAILRKNPTTQNTIYGTGIAYPQGLQDLLLEKNRDSKIVKYTKENPTIDPLTGNSYADNSGENDSVIEETIKKQYEKTLRELGGINTPNNISIYAKDFDSKVQIKEHIDAFNATLPKDEQVNYTDIMALVMSALTTLVDIISYVLLAFSGISLFVSSIMIAVITYVSVIERTKEIGILRSIGARKKDISRVFNAETFMIGLLSGIIGVGFAWIMTIIINPIINSIAGGTIGSIAVLSPLTGLIMILISIGLTILAGLIPSRMASKKNPITCLRTE